jgi:hypothetical protein
VMLIKNDPRGGCLGSPLAEQCLFVCNLYLKRNKLRRIQEKKLEIKIYFSLT